MNLPAGAPAWAGREKPLAALAALVTAVGSVLTALGETDLAIYAGIALVVVGVLGLAVAIAGLIAAEREGRAEAKRRFRTQIAPIDEVSPIDVGVDRADQTMLPEAEAKVPVYQPRTIDDQLDVAIAASLEDGDEWLVIVHGPSKVGKSRSLFEALRRVDPADRPLSLIAPKDAAAMAELIKPGRIHRSRKRRYVLWLDDIEPFVGGGVDLNALREWHTRLGAIVVGTYGGKGGRSVSGDRVGLGLLADAVLSAATEVSLGPTTAAELEAMADDLTPSDLEVVEDYGLAAALVAAPKLERRLMTAQQVPGEESRAGRAVVRAAIDWVRCGRLDPIPRERLRDLWATYLGKGTPANDAAFEEGLDWALTSVGGEVAMLSGDEDLQVYDYVVKIAFDHPQEFPAPPDATWRQALDTDDPAQLLEVGSSAYLEGREGDAEAALRAVSGAESSRIAAVANMNLGVLLQGQERLQEAEEALRRSADLDWAPGANNLGVLLWHTERLEEAETELRRAIAIDDLGGFNANLGAVLDLRGKPKEAEAVLRHAMDMGDPEGTGNLGRLLKKQGRTDEARPVLEKGMELGHGWSAIMVGVARAAEGDGEGAMEAFEKAAAAGDEDADYFAGMLQKEGTAPFEEMTAEQGEEEEELPAGDDPEVLIVTGRQHWEDKDFEAAEKCFRAAIKLGSPEAAFHLMALLKGQGDDEGAGMALEVGRYLQEQAGGAY